MSLKKNIIYLHFKGKHLITSKSQYQYNYGQYLYFADLNLPQAFEVHFSNKERGESETQIGSNKLVEIPDKYFWNSALEIYAWVYLHDETNDGKTIYEVRIPLIKRARPTDKEPLPDQQSAIDKAIAELNNALNITNENADKTNADKIQVATIKEEVVVLKEEINTTANAVSQDAQSANTAAERSEQSAQNSAESERKALDYSDEAKGYAQSAFESKNTASQKAQVATNASAEAKDFRDEAETFKNEAEQIKQNVVDYRNETKGYRDEALTAKNDAQDSVNAAQKTLEQVTQAGEEIIESVRDLGSRYATQAETAANNAQASAESASASASASAQSASEAQSASTNAQTYALNSGNKAVESAQSAQASANSATQAQGYANDASTSAQSASGYATQADISANTASNKASEASTSASTASQKATEASQSASQASGYAQTAESAKTDAQTAQGKAEDAQTAAETAQGKAEDAQEAAESAAASIQSSASQIAQNTADIADLQTDVAQNEADILKAFPTDSTSGSIASFSDGADNLPLKSLVIDINPVQDLHGQESPYPAGGGKNLLPYAIIESPLTKNGITFVRNQDGSIAVNGTSTRAFAQTFVDFALQPGNYYFNCGNGFSMQSNISLYIRDLDNSRTLTEINTYNVGTDRPFSIDVQTNIRFYMVFSTVDLVISGTLYPMIRLASVTDATYAPYENICPISGWTQIGVNQFAVNVWDEEWELGTLLAATGQNAVSTTQIRSKNYISVKPSETYYNKGYALTVYQYGVNKDFLEYSVENVGTFTLRSDCHFIRFWRTATTYNSDISINYPSTDHDYHPYTGRSITIQLGQTVYGGKLDVLSGVLTVDRAMYLVDGSVAVNSVMLHNSGLYFTIVTTNLGSKETNPLPLSNRFKPRTGVAIGNCYITNFGQFIVAVLPDQSITTNEDATQWFADNPTQFVYELATPIEIQLSANQINSLLGVNNIWADSGDTEVVYRADTKLFIERLTAPDSEDMVADSNIVSGQYFMVGNTLYKATANIANGSAIVVGTNCIRKSLSEALNEINA